MSTLAVGDDGFIVTKQVTVCPKNPENGLPAINGAIMVLDAQTGILQAILDANWITAVRTAALSAVAGRRLAVSNAQSVAFVGAGVQAHSHLAAYAELFPLKSIYVFGRSKANIEKLCKNASKMGLEAKICTDAKGRTFQCRFSGGPRQHWDFSTKPFLDARWLKPNAFATITDACIPWIPKSMKAFQTIIVDDSKARIRK